MEYLPYPDLNFEEDFDEGNEGKRENEMIKSNELN